MTLMDSAPFGCYIMDTVFHRVYACPEHAEMRSKVINPELLRRALELGPGPLTERGLVVLPTGDIPRRNQQQVVEVAVGDFDLEKDMLKGDCFMDGAFFPSQVHELARAPWSLNEVDDDGRIATPSQ